MPNDVTVRRMEADDLDGIRRVAERAWRETYDGVLPEDAVETMLETHYAPEVLSEIRRSDAERLFVAADEGDVVGYAASGGSDAAVEGEISIYVAPDRWGSGIGERLLDRAVEDLSARGVDRVEESVLAENEVGRAFYEKHFERTDEREIEVGGETTAVNVYEREIA
ncbi:N-acetyltransferase [Halobacteriales archaeon QS_9_68_17]|nr:MAG: N-acetyltransferase [Halobacteriales archaeon QS_9_68_17]